MANQTIPPDAGKMSFTHEQLIQLKSEVLLDAPYASRVSFGLFLRLVMTGDTIPVLRQIDALEGRKPRSTVKEPSPFKHPPLAPFWHAHYFTSRHTLRNIGERWNIARGPGNDDLGAALNAVAEQHGHDPDVWPGALAHRVFIEGMNERTNANRLTGDWIIFAKHDGQNYYLDLARHEEAQGPIRSAALMQKLRASSAAEFPFLFPD
ncbi:hypothetical protein [Bradyrhizobium sp. B039]|uniref:hypothetical protein n=1 Tax=Bradyrhizobium sp. B039 TaxID=3140239 RepID=UPI003182CE99